MIKKEKIEDFLLENGFKPNLKGFAYLTFAIQIYRNDISMTKELYPQIAKEFNTIASRAERALRHSIKTRVLADDSSNAEYIAKAKLLLERE